MDEFNLKSKNLVGSLIKQMSHDELIALIMQIDKEVNLWDFTNDLYEYFSDKHKEFLSEEENDYDDPEMFGWH